MNALALKIGGIALAALLLAGLEAWALFSVYDHGKAVKDAEWQVRWSNRDAGDKQAWGLAEAEERDKEQARQNSINKAVQDGQRTIDEAFADAAAARADLSLRDQADRTASRTASQVSGNSCTAAASAAASRAVLVLADVLKRADQRAEDLAAIADQRGARGVTCEQAYDGIGNRSISSAP
ncbi:hypothetical protein A9978_10175 [Pseudomonas sp. UMC65]|uniref:DUF2514 family protein n=1 Tax=unclassified Pseudomonas TaxID=196821 RepID=UPI0015FEC1DF|nr:MULTISPECIES: DUF2514 family protein [unclassified Pseudomonas]MBB1612810.1 hypothetical protein [Pseudomonas sp. UMC65]MBB1623058.1 hypothetical protein [Pseudomonas sp. UME65]